VPPGTLLFVMEGGPAPADATFFGSFRQTLNGEAGQAPRVVTIMIYRKN
jgi:hypothetical protein